MLITGGTFTSGVLLQKISPPPAIVSTPLFNATSVNDWTDLTRIGNPAQVGNYLVFTGSESLFTTNIDTTTLTNDDYTYEFWVRTTGSNSGALLTKIGPGGYTVSAVEISATTLVPGYWVNPQIYSEISTPITRDEWQHYVVTYTTNGPLITYYNGQMVDNGTFPEEVSPRDYNISEMYFDLFAFSPTNFGNGNALAADFGEFRYYTRALSGAEVLQNFEVTRGRWGI
jgi:hypothetical protein